MTVENQFEIPNGLVCKVTPLNDKKASMIAKACERLRCGVTEENRHLFLVVTVRIGNDHIHLIYSNPHDPRDPELMLRMVSNCFKQQFFKTVDSAFCAVHGGHAYHFSEQTFNTMCLAVKYRVTPAIATILQPKETRTGSTTPP